jgi:putative FmdB family regulatory protein
MPIYDYVCQSCQRPFDVFLTYSEYGVKPVHCLHCGSDKVKRRPPRVRLLRSEDSHMEDMAGDFSGMEGLEDDPQALGRMMRKMGREMGEDLPPEFDDVVDRLEAGQSPEEIESALPDLGGDAGGNDDEE